MGVRWALAGLALAAIAGWPLGARADPMLWPKPQNATLLAGDQVPVRASGFRFVCADGGACPELMEDFFEFYAEKLQWSCADHSPGPSRGKGTKGRSPAAGPGQQLTQCSVKVASGDTSVTLSTRYDYNITVASDPLPRCEIEAGSMFGALYAFDTLGQLCDSDPVGMLPQVRVVDFPRFSFRGLLVDTARHFLPVPFIKRVVDNMVVHRYNVMHWHIVDSQAFPCQSARYPRLAEMGAYHPAAIYSREDMESVVRYAADRGVIVMPEFDVPGHGSWGFGYPDLMGCPTVLDPTEPKVYAFLKDFLEEMLEIFPSEFIFLGGDEVDSSCWDDNAQIAKWLAEHNMTSSELFDYFWRNVTSDVLPSLGRKVGIWESDRLDIDPKLLPDSSFGNVWQSPKSMGPIIDAGMPVVLSGTFYLDQENPIMDDKACLYYAWQDTWKCMYQEEPFAHLTKAQQELVLGGEAAMWAEGVNQNDFEVRVWAKAAAVAERLWSSETVKDLDDAETRLKAHICRLNMAGVDAGPVAPNFCLSDLTSPFQGSRGGHRFQPGIKFGAF